MRNRLIQSSTLAAVAAALAAALAPVADAGSLGATTTTGTFGPVADAYVSSAKPNTNYGGGTKLRTVNRPTMRSYLRFDLRQSTGSISRATLWVYSFSKASKKFDARPVERNDWGERKITYATAPAVGGVTASATAPAPGWVGVDVTPVVTAGKLVSVALTHQPDSDVTFASREAGGTSPQLVVQQTIADSTAPSFPANLAVTGSTSTGISVTWSPASDDVGVVGYTLYRDSTRAGTSTATGYTFENLACGTTYLLGVEAHDVAGNVSARSSIQARPAACPAASMPRGIFTNSSADFGQVGGLAFGFVMASGYRSNLDRAHSAGVKVLVWLGGYSQDTCSFSWDDAKIKTRIDEIRGHPAILGYFIDDEPHAGPECSNTPAQVRGRNDLVKSLDPGALTVITENRTEAFGPLAGTADVMGLVIYPCNVKLNGCDWSKIGERVALAEAAGVTRYWAVVQTAGDEWYKKPTPDELVRILGQWHATRMEGIFAYTWDCCGDPLYGLRDAPELWDVWKNENGG